MAEIGKWNGHSFMVSPSLIRGFTDLTIKGSVETEDKTSGNEKYVAVKNSNPYEVGLKVELSAFVGCDVRTEAMALAEDARSGASDYFYVGGKKLVTPMLMLTEASVEDVQISPGGTWIKASVNLTMKSCTKSNGTVTSGSSGSAASKSTEKGRNTAADNLSLLIGAAVTHKANELEVKVEQASSTVSSAKKVSAAKAANTSMKTVTTAISKKPLTYINFQSQ